MTVQRLETIYGPMFVPDTDAGQYWWLANTAASVEDAHIEMICDLLDARPRATAVDVGANFGVWSLALRNHAHSVLAIEPQMACVKLLRDSLAAGGSKNVRIYHAAAGERPGTANIPEVDLSITTNFGGVSILMKTAEQPDAQVYSVPMVRVDDLVRGEQVSFIKADVEGYEAKVLAGCRDTIRRCKPILFVEMDHPKTDGIALRRQIEVMGYAVEKIWGNYLGMPL